MDTKIQISFDEIKTNQFSLKNIKIMSWLATIMVNGEEAESLCSPLSINTFRIIVVLEVLGAIVQAFIKRLHHTRTTVRKDL